MRLLLFLLFPIVAFSNDIAYNYDITRVIDGDTVVISAPYLPDPLPKELSLRIFGIDTPEKGKRAHCESEAEFGIKSSKFTLNLINHSTSRKIVIYGWDKYGGRVLGDVILDGVSLKQMLLNNGYAKPYFGQKKDSWCLINP